MNIRFLFVALVCALALGSCGGNARTELFNGKDLAGWYALSTAWAKCLPGRYSPSGTAISVSRGSHSATCVLCGSTAITGSTPSGAGSAKQRTAAFSSACRRATRSGLKRDRMPAHGRACGRPGVARGCKGRRDRTRRQIPIKARIGDAGCEKPAGEWNEAEIVCQGDRMAVYINGVLQNECSGTNRTGYIALQSEGGTLEFRNVYLTDVK